jgi:hypothetical protein
MELYGREWQAELTTLEQGCQSHEATAACRTTHEPPSQGLKTTEIQDYDAHELRVGCISTCMDGSLRLPWPTESSPNDGITYPHVQSGPSRIAKLSSHSAVASVTDMIRELLWSHTPFTEPPATPALAAEFIATPSPQFFDSS